MDQQEKYLLILKVRPEEISIWSCSESLTFIEPFMKISNLKFWENFRLNRLTNHCSKQSLELGTTKDLMHAVKS